MSDVAAVIVDIVGSRGLSDRRGAQAAVLEAFARAESTCGVVRPLGATVGDEFQGIYSAVGDAVRVTTLASLLLAEPVEVRAGIGLGAVIDVAGDISDGSAWWRAREAIDAAHGRQDAGDRAARGWCVGGPGDDAAMVNGVLVLRDHIVARMKDRERRIAALLLQGESQERIAQVEAISQSAVSQNAHRSGAIALRAALDQLSPARAD